MLSNEKKNPCSFMCVLFYYYGNQVFSVKKLKILLNICIIKKIYIFLLENKNTKRQVSY